MVRFFREKKAECFFILFYAIFFLVSTRFTPWLSETLARRTGILAKADLLLGTVISQGMLRGRRETTYYALTVGFLFDVYVGNPFACSPLIFFLCGYFAGRASRPYLHKSTLSAALTAASLVWVRTLISTLYLAATANDTSPLRLIFMGVLPEYLANIVATAAMFTVMYLLMLVCRIPIREDLR